MDINITDIEWVEPPAKTPPGWSAGGNRRRSALRDFAALLQLRPGQWAKFPKLTKVGYSTSTFREMGILNVEATTRRVKLADGTKMAETYCRYVDEAA